MELLQNENEDIKMKALVVIQKLMGHLEKAEASPIAVQLAEKLLPLFDEVRLMGEPKPCSWALGKDSCPSAQPCQQCSDQGLLISFLLQAPVGASGFCSPAQIFPGSCSQSPEGSPAVLWGRTRHSPQTPWQGAEAEQVGHGAEALLRSSPQSAPQPIRGELFPSMAGVTGGVCWLAGRAL